MVTSLALVQSRGSDIYFENHHTSNRDHLSKPDEPANHYNESHVPPTPAQDQSPPPSEESFDAKIERLGRERPPLFHSLTREILFVFSTCMSQILTEFFVAGFNLVLPDLIEELDIPQAAIVWPATAFSLVIASTLLVWGRLGDMWGGYPIYLFGLSWLLVWSVIAGFSINPLMLDFCRALQGLGAAAYLPTGVMLMGSVYRPGPRKNLVFAIYGTCAVVGFYLGILMAGIVGQYLPWKYFFIIGAALAGVTIIAAIFSIPNDRREHLDHQVSMDWLGAITIVCGLVLVVFSITESAHAPNGWRTPYIPTLFVVGVLSLLAAVYVEGWVAKEPLLPLDIFAVKAMSPLIIGLMLLYGTIGIYLLYGTQYFLNIMGASPLQIVAWYTPMFVGGLFLSTIEGFILHLVSGRILLIISGCGALGAQLLLALLPEHGNYWAWIFPAMILGTMGIDLSVNLASVFITTKLPKARQGLGGGLLNSVLQLGLALMLGFSDIIQVKTEGAADLATSYKNTFWFGVAVSGLSLVVLAVGAGVPRAKSGLTEDEKLELEKDAQTSSEE